MNNEIYFSDFKKWMSKIMSKALHIFLPSNNLDLCA